MLHAKSLLCLTLLVIVACAQQQKIKHYVSIMLENRSFDHYLGHLKKTNPQIDGVDGSESNPIDPLNPSKGSYKVHFNATDTMDFDPHHDVGHVTVQVFGSDTPVSPAPMDGFVAASPEPKSEIMRCLNASMTPVMTMLAQEFALFDKWHCSVPGPTEPNRLFYMSGTSYGATENDEGNMIGGYPQRTLFDDVFDSNHTFKIYYGDIPAALTLTNVRNHAEDIVEFRHFFDDALKGTLPTFSFIEPRYFSLFGVEENDQHPPTSISQGEFLVKSVYEAVRNSPQWEETMLIITYDEHGGLYDHVPTPLNVPNPDGRIGKNGFTFERLGIRVPTIIVSPWVAKGTLVHEPAKNHFDHTSLAATLRKMMPMQAAPLTKREAWAASFENIFESLESPRTDCPTTLPVLEGRESAYEDFLAAEKTIGSCSSTEQVVPGPIDEREISGLQWEMINVAWGLSGGRETKSNLKTAHDGAIYVRTQLQNWLQMNKAQSSVAE